MKCLQKIQPFWGPFAAIRLSWSAPVQFLLVKTSQDLAKTLSTFHPTASKLVLLLSLFSVMAVTFHQSTRLKITINCSSRSNHFFADRLQPELDYITSTPAISPFI